MTMLTVRLLNIFTASLFWLYNPAPEAIEIYMFVFLFFFLQILNDEHSGTKYIGNRY